MSEQRKAVIKNADMDEKMQQDAVDIASKALSEYNIEKVSLVECLASNNACKRSFSLTYMFLGRGGVHQERIRP